MYDRSDPRYFSQLQNVYGRHGASMIRPEAAVQLSIQDDTEDPQYALAPKARKLLRDLWPWGVPKLPKVPEVALLPLVLLGSMAVGALIWVAVT